MTEVEQIEIAERMDGSFPRLTLTLGRKYTVKVLRTPVLELVLHDERREPMPDTPFRVLIAGKVHVDGTSSPRGVARVKLPLNCPERLILRWGSAPGRLLDYRVELFTECMQGTPAQLAVARLNNLGYPSTSNLSLATRQFQSDFEVDHEPEPKGPREDGSLPDATTQLLDEIFRKASLSRNLQTMEQPAVAPGVQQRPVASPPPFMPSLFRFGFANRRKQYPTPIRVICFEILLALGIDPWLFFRQFETKRVTFLGRSISISRRPEARQTTRRMMRSTTGCGMT